LREMAARGWDLFVTANYRTVYYLSGRLGAADVPTALVLTADGRCTVIEYETYSIARCLNDLAGDAVEALRSALPDNVASLQCGVEAVSLRMAFPAVAVEDASQVIFTLRKKKHQDEIAEIRESLRLCAVAYDAAKPMMRPGLTEIDVHSAMSSAVNRAAGTAV